MQVREEKSRALAQLASRGGGGQYQESCRVCLLSQKFEHFLKLTFVDPVDVGANDDDGGGRSSGLDVQEPWNEARQLTLSSTDIIHHLEDTQRVT